MVSRVIRVHQDLVNVDGRIGPRSANAIQNHIQDMLTQRISTLLAKLADTELSQSFDTITHKRSLRIGVSVLKMIKKKHLYISMTHCDTTVTKFDSLSLNIN